jgi:hypothetical protein
MPHKTLLRLAVLAVLGGMAREVRAQFPTGGSTPKGEPDMILKPAVQLQAVVRQG